MSNTFARPVLTGFAQAHYHTTKKKTSFLGFIPEDPVIDKAGGGNATTFTDPIYEIDFYALSCAALKKRIDSLAEQMTMSRYTQAAGLYYGNKLNEMKSVYASKNCGKAMSEGSDSGTVTTTTPPPPASGGGGIDAVLIPVVPLGTKDPDTSGGASSSFGGGGAGGGGAEDPTKKKFDWWLIACIAGGVWVGYQTFKSKAA